MIFLEYLAALEQRVAQGVLIGCLGKNNKIYIRNNNLYRSTLALAIGYRIPSEVPFAMDFYGVLKKSDGFWGIVDSCRKEVGGQIKGVVVPVVYFNSLQLEMLMVLAPELVEGFKSFKCRVLDLRGFKHPGVA